VVSSTDAPGTDGGASKTGPLPFDITQAHQAHQARQYDYYLDGTAPVL
jgi:hypothetical protein